MKKLTTTSLLFFYSLVVGCTTDPETGQRKIVGLIPAGVSNTFKPIKQTWLQIMSDQMAGWQWTAIVLIIVGVVIAKLRIFPNSGLGVTLAVLGLGFSAWGLAAPKLVGMLTVIVIGLCVVGISYVAFCLITGKDFKQKNRE